MDVDEFTVAGLYDAAAPDAAERLALLSFLADSGAGIDEMQYAESRGRLFALAGDRIVRPGRDQFTLAELADQLDQPLVDVEAVWRALGLVDTGAAVASPSDVAALHTVLDVAAVIGLDAALGVARVIAAALARVGDATSTAVRGRVPGLAIATSGSELDTAKSFAALADFVPRMSGVLDAVFRHHLESARMHFERTESWDAVSDNGINVAVGFADLSGFTDLTQAMTLPELSSLLSVFEQVADDVVRSHEGRVAKYIGDAVMFVSPRPAEAVQIARDLLAAAAARGMQARAGVTCGQVLALEGDYFGPVVNLAARLVGMAAPQQILVTEAVASALPGGQVEPMTDRAVRGFAVPVAVGAVR